MSEDFSPAPANLRAAGFWIRALARFLDWIVLGLVALFIGVIYAVLAGALEVTIGRPATEMIEAMQKTTVIGWIGSIVATLAYHTLFEAVAGSTVGKRLLGLHVIGIDVRPVRLKQALKRSVGFLVDALFFGMVAASIMSDSPEKQRFGDRWGGTRVVFRRSLPAELIPPAKQWVAALIFALDVAALVTILTQVLDHLAMFPEDFL